MIFRYKQYENEISYNQDLTFHYLNEILFNHENNFSNSDYIEYQMINNGNYTNLAYLLSDQCESVIKIINNLETQNENNKEINFSGSVLKQLDGIFNYLNTLNKTNFDCPFRALRENLINAVIHNDYSFSKSNNVQITIGKEKLVIKNNTSINNDIDLEDMLLGFSSPRNPKLSNIFDKLKLSLLFGTGIPITFASYDSSTIKPDYAITNNQFIVTLPYIK